MTFDWWTLGFQTVNFAVLVWLLYRLLYQPVLRMIDSRRAEMEKQYAEASAATVKAQQELAEVEAARAKIAGEREATLTLAAAQAEEAAKARRAQAESEAAALLDGARKSIAEERQQVVAEARSVAVDLGAEVARRLLDAAPLKARSEAWLDQIEHYLAALPESERNALAKQLEDSEPLVVATASPLRPEEAETWRAQLRRLLGAGVSVTFNVDPLLLAGAELHFPAAILRFSWQNALELARLELEGS